MSKKNELRSFVSEYELIDSAYINDKYNYSGIAPEIIVFPESVEEISEIMKFCFANNLAVTPVGSGTKLFVGNSPSRSDVVLSTKKLNKVLAHEPSDMISTAQCGISVKELHSFLKTKKQFFPIDSPFYEAGETLGGLIATNLCGPYSARYGTCREVALGIKAVRADGEIIKGGAKVVKNVAGYDIPKLLVGSLGTLAVVVEATLRLYPIQENSETIALGFERLGTVLTATEKVLNANIVPTCFDIFKGDSLDNKIKFKPDYYYIALRVDNFKKAVEDQIAEIKSVAGNRCKDMVNLSDKEEDDFWSEVRKFPFDGNGVLAAKINIPMNNCLNLMGDLDRLSANMNISVKGLARPLRGVLLVSMKGANEELIMGAKLLRGLASVLNGSVMFFSNKSELNKGIDIWGAFGGAKYIMENLKANFDSRNILNPAKIF